MTFWDRVLLAAVVITGLLVIAVLVFRFGWKRGSRLRTILMRAALLAFGTLYALLALEVGFYLFFKQSDSFGYTLAAKRWFAKYWKPINSLGIRDVEHDPEVLAGKRVAFVVGDSFVAGHGVADPADRFANVLGRGLGEDWEVVILARNGWNTHDEYEAIVSYPVKPEVMVLSYYFNDIDNVLEQHDLKAPQPFALPPPAVQEIVQRSHLLNFMYWRIYRFWNAEEIDRIAWEWFEDVWQRDDLWKAHSEQLLEIARYARDHQVRLYVVVFPQLRDLNRSRLYTTRVAELMRQNGAEVLDLAEELQGRDTTGLIVGPLDNHPNETLHGEVGAWLLARIGVGK